MSKEVKAYIERLCSTNHVAVPKHHATLFEQFTAAPLCLQAYNDISTIQQRILKDWRETIGIADIKQKAVQLPNGRVGKPYTYTFDPVTMGLNEVAFFELANTEGTGLEYDAASHTLGGTPATAGEYKLQFRFRHAESAEDSELQVKELSLIINADPKSLWKDEPSDREDPYWKEDAAATHQALCGKTVVVASKRGRSHAHDGRFRDDDFLVAALDNGWGLIAVADGAGSAKYSRRGSKVACDTVADYFRQQLTAEQWEALEQAISANQAASTEDTKKTLSKEVLAHMGKAAFAAHTALTAEAATKPEAVPKDYSTTLLFVLLKQYNFGYFITSFWVGDGGVGILSKDRTEVMVLGTPDGGEFAGQTRFLTMPEIFQSPDFYSRFSIKTLPDFTAIMLMTDGITDPKFSTDANLGRVEKWNELWDDLGGKNEDNARVVLEASNEQIETELLSWLDFWSPGNHDDRTLAILF